MHVYISIHNELTDLLNHLMANVISSEINDFKLDELLIHKHDLSFFKVVFSIGGWL